jgi:hypothetical protein
VSIGCPVIGPRYFIIFAPNVSRCFSSLLLVDDFRFACDLVLVDFFLVLPAEAITFFMLSVEKRSFDDDALLRGIMVKLSEKNAHEKPLYNTNIKVIKDC